jgi:cell division protein ZapA
VQIIAFPCGRDGDSVRALMSGTPVELKIGGQTYRVLASADEAELRRLAEIVDTRLRTLTTPGRQVSPQTLLLAALALAHDLEQERERRLHVEARAKEMLHSVLERIDAVLDSSSAPDGESVEQAEPGDEAPLT